MELIALFFGVFGIGFWPGILIQRLAIRNNNTTTHNQNKIKERK